MTRQIFNNSFTLALFILFLFQFFFSLFPQCPCLLQAGRFRGITEKADAADYKGNEPQRQLPFLRNSSETLREQQGLNTDFIMIRTGRLQNVPYVFLQAGELHLRTGVLLSGSVYGTRSRLVYAAV